MLTVRRSIAISGTTPSARVRNAVIGMMSSLFLPQLSALDQFGRHAVVLSQPTQCTFMPEIGPAVADMDECELSGLEETSRTDRGSHASNPD